MKLPLKLGELVSVRHPDGKSVEIRAVREGLIVDDGSEIDEDQWPDILAKLCDTIRREGGQAVWNGEYLMIQWPDRDPLRVEIIINHERLLTEI